jgi:hypothetical protein
MADNFLNLTDPLVSRSEIVWDEGAQVVERLWWHNRFGRFYDVSALRARVLGPADKLGFQTTVYLLTNVEDVLPHGRSNFALVMQKPYSAADS